MPTIIKPTVLTSDNLEPVGRCWKYARFDLSVKDASTVNEEVRCEPEEATVTIKKGVCCEPECPFNTLNFVPSFLRPMFRS